MQPFDDRERDPFRICFEDAHFCDLECTKLPGGSGAPDADFILYVTAKHDAGCAGSAETVASAGFCSVHHSFVRFVSEQTDF